MHVQKTLTVIRADNASMLGFMHGNHRSYSHLSSYVPSLLTLSRDNLGHLRLINSESSSADPRLLNQLIHLIFSFSRFISFFLLAIDLVLMGYLSFSAYRDGMCMLLACQRPSFGKTADGAETKIDMEGRGCKNRNGVEWVVRILYRMSANQCGCICSEHITSAETAVVWEACEWVCG